MFQKLAFKAMIKCSICTIDMKPDTPVGVPHNLSSAGFFGPSKNRCSRCSASTNKTISWTSFEGLMMMAPQEPGDIRDSVDGKQLVRPLAGNSAVQWMVSFESSRSKYGPATAFVVASGDRFLSRCAVRFGETQLYPDEVISTLGIFYTIPQERKNGLAKVCVRGCHRFCLETTKHQTSSSAGGRSKY